MHYLDLTAELAHHMVRYPMPHISPVEVISVATHEEHKRSVQRINFVTHVSTHIDAPFHAIPDGLTVDQIPLNYLIGECAIVRIRGHDRENPIDAYHLHQHENIFRSYERILLDTGWSSSMWGSIDYFTEGPYLTREAAEYIAGFDTRLIAMDFPNIDKVEETIVGFKAPNHNILLSKGMVFVENLVNLEQLPEDKFRLIALPLKLIGGDGCPCRVIAEINE